MQTKTSSSTDTLFLHMGPGLNSFVERCTLKENNPNIHFWDQPLISDPNNAFMALVGAAEKEIERLFKLHGRPIRLMAHSFSGHLIRPLLDRASGKISSVEMVSTGYNLPRGFFGLLQCTLKDQAVPEDLRSDAKNFLNQTPSPDNLQNQLWDMIGLLMRNPDFGRYYWPKPEDFKKYSEISAQGPALDIATFKYVVDDFILNQFKREKPYDGDVPVTIRLGDKDPLLFLSDEINDWRRIYPQADIITVEGAGHYIHLEGEI